MTDPHLTRPDLLPIVIALPPVEQQIVLDALLDAIGVFGTENTIATLADAQCIIIDRDRAKRLLAAVQEGIDNGIGPAYSAYLHPKDLADIL